RDLLVRRARALHVRGLRRNGAEDVRGVRAPVARDAFGESARRDALRLRRSAAGAEGVRSAIRSLPVQERLRREAPGVRGGIRPGPAPRALSRLAGPGAARVHGPGDRSRQATDHAGGAVRLAVLLAAAGVT